MEPQVDVMFRWIVFRVTGMIFGEADSSNSILQHIIAGALRDQGIYDYLKDELEDSNKRRK